MKIKELVILLLVAIPLLYLGNIWDNLPQEVPLHWNSSGEIDRIGDKIELLWINLLLNIPVYIVLLVVPIIDPKKKIKFNSKGYFQIRLLLQFFMAALSVFIIHATLIENLGSPNLLFVLIGLLFMGLGFIFNSIKSNYFIGIRTPWTLEDSENWKKTHHLAAKVWKLGGALIVLSSIVFTKESYFVVFINLTLLMAFIPIIYSFWYFKQKS